MDRYLEPGTPVRLTNHADGSWEDGVVVHCWLSEEMAVHDCYVAFFGQAIPEGTASGEALHPPIRLHFTDPALESPLFTLEPPSAPDPKQTSVERLPS